MRAAPDPVPGGVAEIVRRLRVTINGHVYEATVEELDPGEAPAVAAPSVGLPPAAAPPVPGPAASPESPRGAADGAGGVRAPLPGIVAAIKVSAGQEVPAGAVLLILEAMKMENEVVAPVPGTVRRVAVKKGDQVAVDQVLVVLG